MSLYATLSKDPKLAEFSFILTWPKLKDAEKRAAYDQLGRHRPGRGEGDRHRHSRGYGDQDEPDL